MLDHRDIVAMPFSAFSNAARKKGPRMRGARERVLNLFPVGLTLDAGSIMSLLWFLSAASLHAMNLAPGVVSVTPPFGQSPVADQALADAHALGLPIVGIEQAVASALVKAVVLPGGNPRASDIIREVMDNWNFHEGADMIFAKMHEPARNVGLEQQLTSGSINYLLQIGTMPLAIVRQ